MLDSILRKAQFLSIDIVLGAVILLRFFSKELNVSPTLSEYFLLGSGVWLIYTIDHLRDASQVRDTKRDRFIFHQVHKKNLTFSVIIIMLVSSTALFFIDLKVLLVGLVLAGFVSIYLLVQHVLSKKGVKEVYVALVYSFGILLVPFVHTSRLDLQLFGQLFLLTFANLIIFSWFEKKEDQLDGFSSIATIVDENTLEKIIFSVLALGVSISLISSFSLIQGYFMVSFVIYALLFLNQGWAAKGDKYRTIGDGVFLLPILLEWT